MEYLKHKYSHRVYQVETDHNPEKPYLRCPIDSAVRHPSSQAMEKFFTPCKSGACPEDRRTIREELEWERGQRARVKSVEPLNPPREKKTPMANKTYRGKRVRPPEGGYTLKDLCSELGTTPSVARRILRSQGKSAPDGGWKWSNVEEAKGIKKLIKKFL